MKSGRIRFEKFLTGDLIMITIVEAFILILITLLTLGINQVNAAVDLVETHVSNPPTRTTEGGRFWVNDTVQNEGADIAPSSVTRYYLSTTGSKDANSILLSGKRSVASLKPRKRSGGWAIVTVPLGTPTGIYYLVACADDNGVVNESGETNNCISSAKTVQLTAPDLVETSVSDPPSMASSGDSFSVTDTVENQGNRTSRTSITRYYLSSSGVRDNGAILLIGKRSIRALAAGKAYKGTVTVRIPSNATKDMYYLLACADDTGLVNENDETNNCISSTKTVQVTAPDLVETSVSDPPSTASAGDSFSVTDTVENQGSSTPLRSFTQYYLSSSGVKDSGAILLIGKRSIPALTPGMTSKGTVTVEIPFNAKEDTYYLLACADDTSEITEGNEQNNCIASSTQVTLSHPPNVLPVTVNGSLCSVDSYPNKPCVSVTICSPNSTTCQTIDDILLDTGSSGLRIFKQVLSNVSLPQKTVGSAVLAECIQYGDGSSNWGPIVMADIILGNEPAVRTPIQVIDATFGTRPRPCRNADSSPTEALYSGILGVGLFAQDCGSACASYSNNGMYYACAGLNCTGTAVSLSDQVPNPVALLPVDNNGVVVQIPAVPSGGSISVDGQLVLGIGTRSNNMPSAGVISYAVDQDTGYFFTKFNGRLLYSFIDTGSNGLFFPALSSLPDCGFTYGLYSGFFCPSYLVSLSATNRGAYGSPSGVVSFHIANFFSLMSSPNNVFPDIGGEAPGEFDWGLPLHLGRYVYVGIENTSSTLGTGPYWGY